MFLSKFKHVIFSEAGIISIGVLLIILLSISSYFITQKTQQNGFNEFESVIQHNLTSQYLLLTMSNAIRDRMLTVHNVNLSHDPFDIDEFNLKFDHHAIEFVKARDQLIKLGLPQNQLDQLEKLKTTLNSVRSNLEFVVESKTISNDVIYRDILISAQSANASVLLDIKSMIDIQLNNAQLNLKKVALANEQAKLVINSISFFTLFISLLILVYVINILKQRQKQITKAILDLETHNKNLETTVLKRTSDLMVLQKEHSRVNAEIEINRKLQQFITPTHKELKQYKHLDISTYIESAEEVGGDYVDVLPYQGGQLICIGDVTDHGLKSSIIMLMTQSIIRHQSNLQGNSIKQALNDINLSLFQNIKRMKSDRYLSLSLLHLKDNKLLITGQHEVIIIVRIDGTIEKISTDELGFYVGFIDDIEPFTQMIEIDIHPGDLVLLHTDGITEAANSNESLYGFERLCEQAIQHRDASAYDIVHNIIGDLNRFVGAKALYDDVALIAFKVV